MNLLNNLRWVSGAFLGSLNWTPTANRTITLPNDTVTLLGDDRPIGTLNAGVSLRGYEPIVTVTATKTLAMTDSGTVQNCTNAAAAIITIPLNSAVAFPIGAKVIIRKTTNQTVTIALSAGVTVLNSLGTTLTVTGVTSATILRKTGTDSWIAFPDLPESAIGGALRTAVDANSARSTIGLSNVQIDGSPTTVYRSIVAVTATKTITLTDFGTYQYCTNAAAITLTIPLNSGAAFATGSEIEIKKGGTGTLSIAVITGVTLLGDGGATVTTPFTLTKGATIKKVAVDSWVLEGA